MPSHIQFVVSLFIRMFWRSKTCTHDGSDKHAGHSWATFTQMRRKKFPKCWRPSTSGLNDAGLPNADAGVGEESVQGMWPNASTSHCSGGRPRMSSNAILNWNTDAGTCRQGSSWFQWFSTVSACVCGCSRWGGGTQKPHKMWLISERRSVSEFSLQRCEYTFGLRPTE